MTEYSFQEKHKFLEKLDGLLKSGFSPNKMRILLPHPDHDVEHLMEKYVPRSKLKYFTLLGALLGCSLGFGMTIFMSMDWPLIVGGKPIVSLPAFLIIAFELTILFGALISFTGFIILARLPDFRRIITPEDHGNEYILQIESEDEK